MPVVWRELRVAKRVLVGSRDQRSIYFEFTAADLKQHLHSRILTTGAPRDEKIQRRLNRLVALLIPAPPEMCQPG